MQHRRAGPTDLWPRPGTEEKKDNVDAPIHRRVLSVRCLIAYA